MVEVVIYFLYDGEWKKKDEGSYEWSISLFEIFFVVIFVVIILLFYFEFDEPGTWKKNWSIFCCYF